MSYAVWVKIKWEKVVSFLALVLSDHIEHLEHEWSAGGER
jgi:hypothetical protein